MKSFSNTSCALANDQTVASDKLVCTRIYLRFVSTFDHVSDKYVIFCLQQLNVIF